MTAEWLSLGEAAKLCGLTEKHLRRVIVEAKRGWRTWWKERRVVWRESSSGFEVALASLPQEAREAWLVQHYHLNLALPDPPPRNTLNWNGNHGEPDRNPQV